MIPQAKVLVPFIGQDSSDLHSRLMLMVGVVISVFLAGILVTLGISSLILFRVSSKREALSKQGYFLVGYTAILLFLVVAFEVQLFIVCNAPFIFSPLSRALEITRWLLTATAVTKGALWALTDGLLVWRCFRVQKALVHNLWKWGNIFWIFPACLWCITFVASMITGAVSGMAARHLKLFNIGSTTVLVCNIVLNLYATCFISFRLLQHRRMITSCLGDKATTQHLYLVGIFLESAAANTPITITALVGLWVGSVLGPAIVMVSPIGQALAAMLIIHHFALGRAFDQQSPGVTELVKRTEGSDLGSPTPTVTPAPHSSTVVLGGADRGEEE